MNTLLERETMGIVIPQNYRNLPGGFAQRVKADISALAREGYNLESERTRLLFDMYTQILNPFFRSVLRKRSKNYTVILAHLPWSAAASYSVVKSRIPVIYVAHNFEYALIRQTAGFFIIQWLIYFAERYACRKAGKIICVSEKDLRSIKKFYAIPESKLCLIPNTVDVPFLSKTNTLYNKHEERKKLKLDQSSFVVLFPGRINYIPNLDALKFTINELVPTIKNEGADIRIVVAGAGIPKKYLRYRDDIISFHSDVEDMRQFYAVADVVIVPLRLGSGTRIKIMESFAAKVPVISTAKGAEGISYRDRRDILIAQNDARDFLSKIQELSTNVTLRREIIANAYHLVQNTYDTKLVSKRFRTVITEVTKHTVQDFPRK
jgi:glycosyltransferase involved in cell wall biosynthesis